MTAVARGVEGQRYRKYVPTYNVCRACSAVATVGATDIAVKNRRLEKVKFSAKMAAKRKSGGKGKKSAKDGGGVSPRVWAGMAVVAAVVLSVVFSGSNMGEKQPKGKKNRRMAKPPPPPQPTTGIFDESIPFADPNLAQEGPHRALKSDLLQRWNPVAINHTRQLILDPSGEDSQPTRARGCVYCCGTAYCCGLPFQSLSYPLFSPPLLFPCRESVQSDNHCYGASHL